MIVCESGGHANGLTYFIFRFLRRPLTDDLRVSRRAETATGRFSGGGAGQEVGQGRKTPPRPRKRGQRGWRSGLMPRCGRVQVIRHGLGHLSPGWGGLPRQRARRGSPGFQADGGSRDGIPAGAARSPARARTRAGMERGAAPALDATGAPQAYRQGGRSRATPAAPAPAASRASTDAGSPETEAVSGQARRARRRATANRQGMFSARAAAPCFFCQTLRR